MSESNFKTGMVQLFNQYFWIHARTKIRKKETNLEWGKHIRDWPQLIEEILLLKRHILSTKQLKNINIKKQVRNRYLLYYSTLWNINCFKEQKWLKHTQIVSISSICSRSWNCFEFILYFEITCILGGYLSI